ncbi:MAG TPA: class I SAM-dependent methyltransferase, partial [Candidatus Sulfotelmatobacter sp.]|nr:class I SAM-dependent methyltransferase [Candidatus Sulfotelmatobacter sp.]
MERSTVDVYEARGEQWAAKVRPLRADAARRFASAVPAGGIALDVGCGTGRYTADLAPRVIGLDAAAAMLARCRAVAPGAALVQADLEARPFGAGRLRGAWANMSYHHVPSVR